jgi:hypothetical protein
MRVVSRKGVAESLSGGSCLGWIRALIVVWMRVWGVHVRLMNMEVISIIVPGQCELSAFARGVYFCMMSW